MDTDTYVGIGAMAVIILVVTFWTLGPLASIWSLNTLFSLDIPYTFSTWVAALWVGYVLTGTLSKKTD